MQPQPSQTASHLTHLIEQTRRYGRCLTPDTQREAHACSLQLRADLQPSTSLAHTAVDLLVTLELRRASLDQQIATVEHALALEAATLLDAPESAPIPILLGLLRTLRPTELRPLDRLHHQRAATDRDFHRALLTAHRLQPTPPPPSVSDVEPEPTTARAQQAAHFRNSAREQMKQRLHNLDNFSNESLRQYNEAQRKWDETQRSGNPKQQVPEKALLEPLTASREDS